MNYFIIVNDAQQGPYTLEELRQRHITEETLVWCEGMTDWQPAWQVEELRPLFAASANGSQPTPPPVPHAIPQGSAAGQTPTADAPLNADAPGHTNAGAANTANAAPEGPQPPKSHKKLYITLGVVAVVLFLLALANPGQAEHRRAIDEKLDDASLTVDRYSSNPFEQSLMSAVYAMGKSVAVQYLKDMVDSGLTYHNYIFFSTTTIHSDAFDKDIRTSTGYLGHVSAIDLSAILPDLIRQQVMSRESADSDGDTQGEQTTITTHTVKQNGVTLDSVTKRVTTRIADDVARKVKEEVKQQADSIDAKDVDGIVDEVVNFLKSIL